MLESARLHSWQVKRLTPPTSSWHSDDETQLEQDERLLELEFLDIDDDGAAGISGISGGCGSSSPVQDGSSW